MKNYAATWTLLVFTIATSCYGQNLPSLLTGKDINSTFSILAFDAEAQEWGVAVATNNIYVGSSTIYIQPGVGAFSVIAETEPKYGIEGLEKLKAGKTITDAIEEVRQQDNEAHIRQVSGIDEEGNVYSFTGESLKYWKGNASEISGDHYVVMGNQLADEVLSMMSKTFENSSGTLAERLLKSLVAGQNAGGQISGKQSAAVVVKGRDNEWYNQIDLRVDNSKDPIGELETLMNYHYGRIFLNQAMYANRGGNTERAKTKLKEAESMLAGWDGMYAKIAMVNILMGNEDVAVSWVKRGLEENPAWAVNLPAFYCLRNNSRMKSIIKPADYGVEEWEIAIGMLSNLGREMEAIKLAEKLIKQNTESSYLHFLLGRSFFYEKELENSAKHLRKAIEMDGQNVEAKALLGRVTKD